MGTGRSMAAGLRTLVVAAGAGMATVAAVAVIGPSGAGAAAGTAPCTQAALQAGLSRGTSKVSHAHVVKPFGCSGKWAYAAVDTKRFTLSSLFEVQDGRWATVDRTKPCTDGAVPRAIRKPACESN